MALLRLAAPGIAQDEPPRYVRPSVEELAVQPPKPVERESDTRESICLMIESAARESNLSRTSGMARGSPWSCARFSWSRPTFP